MDKEITHMAQQGMDYSTHSMQQLADRLRAAADEVERIASQARAGQHSAAAARAVDAVIWALANRQLGQTVHVGARADVAYETGEWSL